MYKLTKDPQSNELLNQVKRNDGANIPFYPGNSDYDRFKKQLQGIGEYGVSITPPELQDAEGNVMTSEEVAEFIATLP